MEAVSKTRTGVEKSDMPKIIGCLVADKDGKTLLKFEAFEGALEHYLKREKHSDVELIPMFVSAMARMSGQFNFQQLSTLDVKSTNLSMIVFFFEQYIITFLSRVGVKVGNIEVRNYFTQFFRKHKLVFKKYFKRGIIIEEEILTGEGNRWIQILNDKDSHSRRACDMSYL